MFLISDTSSLLGCLLAYKIVLFRPVMIRLAFKSSEAVSEVAFRYLLMDIHAELTIATISSCPNQADTISFLPKLYDGSSLSSYSVAIFRAMPRSAGWHISNLFYFLLLNMVF